MSRDILPLPEYLDNVGLNYVRNKFTVNLNYIGFIYDIKFQSFVAWLAWSMNTREGST
jgi:hypothetical protein